MPETIGKQLPRAKPINLTFYDILRTQPYTATFYVREDASTEECHQLINAVKALSLCVLGKYKIGFEQYVVPEYQKGLDTISPYAIGTFKWQIGYHTPNGSMRRHTIPGRNNEHSLQGQKTPDPNHPLWKEFLEVFRRLCVTKESDPIEGPIDLSRTGSNWPPKSAKKRKKRRV
ncbi:MAG: hypothetical protein K8S97_04040 [Anaerolineae bacterium]|nr:hypothetical protein [Anaerolineae bacterium]